MLDARHAKACRWFRMWLGTYLLFGLGSALTAPSSAFKAQNLVPGGILVGAVIGLAFYIAWGLGRGKRVGGATALVGFFAIGCPVPIAFHAMHGINPEQAWVVIPLGLLFVAITIYTFVLLLSLRNQARDSAPRQ